MLGNIGAPGTVVRHRAFAQPTGVTIGNTGRNQFRGPGGWNLDFSVFRTFPVGGQRRLEFRFQAQQHLQPPGVRQPGGGITCGTFGQITGIGGGGSYPERQLQLGLRFQF